MAQQYGKITDVPKTVKEAIDWLIRIGDLDKSPPGGSVNRTNCTALYNAIRALTGSTSNFSTYIKTLIEGLAGFIGYQGGTVSGRSIIKKNGSNGSGYTSAYNTTVTWPTCKSGGQCSCCQQGSCNCTASPKPGASSCDGTCCNTCDVRICAGIFVALVPALHTALDGLKNKLKNENGTMINAEPLKGYFTALGYEDKDLNGHLTGTQASNKLNSAISGLRSIKEKIESAFNSQPRPNQNGFTAPKESVAPSSTSTSTPRTLREMLLWLMGLPYCEGYGEFVKKLMEKSQKEPFKSIIGPTRTPSKPDSNPLAKELSAVIFHLPTVFYSIEGHISYLKEVFEQFKNGGTLKFNYPTTNGGTDMLNTLSAYVAVCYPILKYLMQRCDRDDKGSRGRRSAGLSTTPAEDHNGSWGYLTVSGNENSDEKVKSGAAPGSTVPKTALKDFLVFMGFKTGNDTVTGDQLYDKALKDCFSASMKTEDEDEDNKGLVLARSSYTRAAHKDQKLPALRKLAKHVLQGLYTSGAGVGGAGVGGGAASGAGGEKVTPSTIRQMMLWLIGLPLTEAYKQPSATPSGTGALFGENGPVLTGIKSNTELMALEKGQQGRRRPAPTTATGKHFKQQLKDSIVGMIMLFQRIEGSVHSVLEFLQKGFIDKSGGGSSGAVQPFKYDQDKLFNDFASYVYKVHVQLRFLKVMCKTGKNDGGWQECEFESDGGSLFQGITCSCSNSFLGTSCPTPLRHYLNGNGKNKFTNGENIPSMCFNMKYLTTDKRLTGASITPYLEPLLDEIPTPTTAASQPPPTPKPLSLLTQYCVAIGNMEPVSLGDHFDVFRELGNGMWKKIESKVKKELGGITKEDKNGTEGSNALQGALKEVFPDQHTTHTGDLASLTGCSDSTCTPFVASLSYGLYKYCDPEKLITVANKIDWIYMKMSSLYGKLTKLLGDMKKGCRCCPEGEVSSSSSCPGIIKCPNCLPQLYKMGLVFGSAETLTTGKSGAKKCRDLHTMMDKVLVTTTSKLCIVFESIDGTRFWPYLLFSAMVVKGKYGNNNGDDDNYNCYTYALGNGMYDAYLKEMEEKDKKEAQTNKEKRTQALKCACSSHTYIAPTAGTGTATTVTLTLYFHKDGVTTKLDLIVPHHGQAFNPLVRVYPRNLKSIVDWLLRIGQTRLEQKDKDESLKEMCKTLWPKIHTHLTVKDQGVFKKLVTNVMSLMGLENKGKEGVEKEVKKEYDKAQKNIQKKLNGGNDKFDDTFNSILTFNPKEYIDKVIEDFGKRVCTVKEASGSSKQRDFNCVAKSVSQCMSTALEKIKELVKQNKKLEKTYGIQVPDVNNDIQEVSQLKSIENLKQLCDGFKDFHEAYTTVTGAFTTHLTTAQKNGGNAHWEKINKCVEAFKDLGQCANDISTLSSYNDADSMTQASGKLNDLSTKLQDVHEKLNGDEIKTVSAQVEGFIQNLDKELEKKGSEALESALNSRTGSSTSFSDFLKSYVSNVLEQLKKNNTNNTVCDIHLRVRNDLLQLSECLKVMCEVCSTGMTEFAHMLKECVDKGKGHLEQIKKVKDKLDQLKKALQEIKEASSQDSVKDKVTSAISSIKELLKDPYIYQAQPIVKEFINNSDAMTKYLKQLPDLIRDRYVLQKWTDEPEDFCGVQRFENGIVKGSDIKGIEDKLKELLKDTYHDENTYCVTIHEFQVRALIYNFCHKEAMENIIAGLEVMESVKKALENGNVDWSSITSKKQELLPLLTSLSTNSYLRYFATHLRDSIGYHTLSNTLGALEQVKEKLGEKNGGTEQPSNWNDISKLLQQKTMQQLQDRLSSLLDKLNREYIFEYPPFDWTKSCQKLMREQEEAKKAAEAARAKRATDASAPSPTPSNTCEMCAADMSRIFIGFVPQMYRLFKMLREIAQKEKQSKSDTLLNAENVQDIVNKTLTVAGFFDSEGWRLKLGSGTSVPELGYDLDASKKGTEVCKFLDDIITDKEPGVLVAQKDDASATDLKPLDKLFKAVMQHFRTKRDEKRKKREKALEDEFNKKHKDSGLKFQAPPAPLPSTVRQVLFWLHELDTNKEFYDGMLLHIDNLCQRSSIDISHDTILHVLKLSATQCLEVLATIEDPGRQNADYYYELYTEEHYYAYPVTNIPLFFYTFVEKLMAAFLELNFVCVQCEFRALEGGWSECHIGKSEHSMKGQNCRCTKSHTKASAFIPVTVSGSVVCPRPLSAFLFSDQKNQLKVPMDPTLRLPYMSKGTMPCGFQLKDSRDEITTRMPPPTVTGSVLVEPLRKLVGGHVRGRLNDTSTRKDENYTLSTVIYLRDLLRYVLCDRRGACQRTWRSSTG